MPVGGDKAHIGYVVRNAEKIWKGTVVYVFFVFERKEGESIYEKK